MRVLLKSPIGPGGIFCGAAHGVVWCDKNYGNTKFFFCFSQIQLLGCYSSNLSMLRLNLSLSLTTKSTFLSFCFRDNGVDPFTGRTHIASSPAESCTINWRIGFAVAQSSSFLAGQWTRLQPSHSFKSSSHRHDSRDLHTISCVRETMEQLIPGTCQCPKLCFLLF